MYLYIVLWILCAFSDAVAIDDSDFELYMFAKGDEPQQCAVRKAHDSSTPFPPVLWMNTNYKHMKSKSDFISYTTSSKLELCVNDTEKNCSSANVEWVFANAIEWSLPSLDDYRWEELESITMSPTQKKKLPNKEKWSLGISFYNNEITYIHLLDSKLEVLYKIIINKSYGSKICFKEDWNYCAERKGPIGKKNEWTHLRIDWNKLTKDLGVALQDDTENEVLKFQGDLPDVQNIEVSSSDKHHNGGNVWVLHNYRVVGIQDPNGSGTNQVVSKWFTPASETFCLSFLCIVHEDCYLSVVVSNGKEHRTIENVVCNKNKVNFWQEARSEVENFSGSSPLYLIFKETNNCQVPEDKMAVVISDVRECDLTGDIRKSVAESNSAHLCYISGSSRNVTLKKADIAAATNKDIERAESTCRKVNNVSSCEAQRLCTSYHCACSPGYYGDKCNPFCGQWPKSKEYVDKYGPGCTKECGKCDVKPNYSIDRRNKEEIKCHHVTGECRNKKCVDSYRPPYCTKELPWFNFAPSLVNKYATSLILSLQLNNITGSIEPDDTIQVKYRSKENYEWKYSSKEAMINDSKVSIRLNGLVPYTEYVACGFIIAKSNSKVDCKLTETFRTTCIETTNWTIDADTRNVTLTEKITGAESCRCNYYKMRLGSTHKNDACNTIFEKLQPFTNYTVYVTRPNNTAITELTFTTQEDAPESPRDLNLTPGELFSTVTLTWNKPQNANGRIHKYCLTLKPGNSSLHKFYKQVTLKENITVTQDTDDHSFTFNNLLPSTDYNVSVFAVTKKEGPSISNSFRTSLAKPDFGEYPTIRLEGKNNIVTINLQTIKYLTQKSSLYLLLSSNEAPEIIPEDSRQMNSITNKFRDVLKNAKLVWMFEKQITVLRENVMIEVGTCDGSKRCQNYTLDQSLEYDIHIIIDNNENDSKPTTWSSKLHRTITKTNGGSNLYALLLLLFVLPLVFVLYVYRHKLKWTEITRKETVMYSSKKNLVSDVEIPCVLKPAIPEPLEAPKAVNTLHIKDADGFLTPDPTGNTYVKIPDLTSYVGRSIASGELRKQHESIPKGQQKPCVRGEMPENKPKNRYKDLIAYDETRVVLKKLTNNPFSDYINANYIHGYKNPRMYIATQGPKSQTLEDFWRMVWQEDIQVIAMLANVIENSKKKCEQYWPEMGQEVTYGLVTILAGTVQVYADFTFRQFYLKYHSINGSRKVMQLHFTSWPDHGVPLYSQSVASYLKKLLATPVGSGPILVHCSAGVGRTGTIMVADACLRMAAAEGAIDAFFFFQQNRQCRASMVDNYEQYKLIHHVLLECLASEPTGLSCKGDFALTLQKLKETGIISKHFELLDKNILPDQEDSEEECDKIEVEKNREKERERNKHKNRVQAIIPGSGRVYLSRTDSDDSLSDYINAITIDGFRIKNQFIATQFPMEHTVKDFWRLIHEKGINTVVVLNEISLKDETLGPFWPVADAALKPTSNITITLKEESHLSYCIKRQLSLTVKHEEQPDAIEKNVIMLHFIGWNSGEILPKTKSKIGYELLELWQETERVYPGENSMVVCCYDGAQACGLFLALSFLVEKMKLEQECDVVHAVRTIRHNRKQFISDKKQFEWLYDTASTFLQMFENYANFQ